MNSKMQDFEQKKVQVVKGSYYIYLPKNLCTKYEIKKSKKVFMKHLENDLLVLRFEEESQISPKSLNFNLDYDSKHAKNMISEEEYVDYILNQYLTAYIIGYDSVVFKKQTKIPMALQNRIYKMTKRLYGMVVISETVNSIEVGALLEEIDLHIFCKQLFSKIDIMINNFIEIVENLPDLENYIELLDELIEQDDQIDEHRYAIERHIHKILNKPSLRQIVDISAVECLHYSEMTRFIERIGDLIVKLAVFLKNQEIKERKFILDQLNFMLGIFDTIHDYFEQNDPIKLWKLGQKIKEYAFEMKEKINDNHPDTKFLVPIRRICNICGDIAEIRINDILTLEV